MSLYLKRLIFKVVGVFIVTLAGLAGATAAFDVLTFNWTGALTVSGSAAVLALLEGLAARFVGDADRPNLAS